MQLSQKLIKRLNVYISPKPGLIYILYSKLPILLFSLLNVLLLLGSVHKASGQAQLGFHLQQHAGINGTVLNPARMAAYPFKWDVNIVGANLFGANDYGFFEQTNLSQMLRKFPNMTNTYGRFEVGDGAKLPPGSYVTDFYDLRRKGYGVASSDIMGPSFGIKINDNHSIGLVTRARLWGGIQNVPSALSYYDFYNQPFYQDISLDPFLLNGLAWTEIGLNYALNLPVNDGAVSIGITVKSLNGYEALYVESEKRFDLVKLPNDSISGTDFILAGAITTANLQSNDYDLQSQGGGLGVDLGILYTVDGDDGNYLWQFGLSLLDVGRMNFTESAEQHRVVGTQQTSLGAVDYSDITGPVDILDKVRLFSTQTLQDADASLTGTSFSMWLPTTLSLQIDHHLGQGIYAGMVLMQGLPMSKQAPNRGSLLGFSPRIEKRWYAFSLPISIYNWDLLRVGFATRLGPLVLGTDDLGSWLVRKDISAGDVYLALKVPFFRFSSKGNGGGNGSRGRGKGRNIRCYTF
jgi:hypothetical protein